MKKKVNDHYYLNVVKKLIQFRVVFDIKEFQLKGLSCKDFRHLRLV